MSLFRHTGTYCACTHAYMPASTTNDASGQRDAAMQIAADRLPVFQRNDTDRICGRVAPVVPNRGGIS